MTLFEARAVLGVTADATAADVRRAYLRLLRAHAPERDPEGFKRLRAAYELLATFALHSLSQSTDGRDGVAPGEWSSSGAGASSEAAAEEAGQLLDEGRIDAAVEAIEREVERVISTGGDLPVGIVLPLVWRLVETGQDAAAEAVMDAVETWTEVVGEARVIDPLDVVVYITTKDLFMLPPRFPAVLRAAIARALRESGDPADAWPVFEEWAADHHFEREYVAAVLVRRTVAFHALLAPLDPSSWILRRLIPWRTRARLGWWRKGPAYLVFLMFAVSGPMIMISARSCGCHLP